MYYGKSKRIIVIRDIHSNLFEEAILVLKEDNNQQQEHERNKKINPDKKNIKNDFILREAEQIINNYIRENKVNFLPPRKREKEILTSNKKFMKNLIINSALLGSIAAVAFLLFKIL